VDPGPAPRGTEELADRFLYARVETDLGCVEAIGGHHAAAAERFERAHAALGEVGAQPWRARVMRLLARVRGDGGDHAASERERCVTPQALQLLLADRPD
jgi:hypothetical protein